MPSWRQNVETVDRWRAMPALERVEPGRGLVALTFDDGPDGEGTPAVLEALDRAGARATFLLVGEQLKRRPRVARELIDRGHEVGVHGFLHERHDSLYPGQARDDLARAVGAFEAATGRRPRWFRPPYGLFSEASYDACSALGMEPVYWSAWGMDWEPIPAERIADLATRDLEDGDVVLLHDSPAYADRPSALPTADAIGLIALAAAERELALVSLGEAVG